MRKHRKIVGLLVCAVMLLGLLPCAPAHGADAGGGSGGSWADAVWVETDDALELHALLEDPDHDYNIRLTGDISFSIDLSSSAQGDSDPSRWPYIPKGSLFWCRPKATKVLDLYGHDLRISYGNSARNGQGFNHYLFKLEGYTEEGSQTRLYPSMTVTDSTVSPGTVNFNGYIHSEDNLLGCYYNYRNLFYVGYDCALTINGGEFICGRSKEQWISRGIRVDDFIEAVNDGNTFLDSFNVVYDHRFDGYARQNVNGHVVYNAGGAVTVNGGVLSGRGYEELNFEVKTNEYGRPHIESTKKRNAAIINSWGALTIVDGDIRGMGCADALQIDNLAADEGNPTRVSDVSILGGAFTVDDIDKVVAPMNDNAVAFEWHLDGYYIDGSDGLLVKDLQSGSQEEAIARVVDAEASVLTLEDDDEATVAPRMGELPLERFYTSAGPAAGSHYIYDPAQSFTIQYNGPLTAADLWEDTCPQFWYPVPAFPGRIWLSDVTFRWYLFDGDGEPVGDPLGYDPGDTRWELRLSEVLTEEEKADLSGTLVAMFCQSVTRYGATTMEAMRTARIRLSVGALDKAEITQQPQAVTLVDSFIDDGYYWHILDVEHYNETGEREALPGDRKEITLTASATGDQLNCWWLVDRGGGMVILNNDQYETTEENGVFTSTLTVPVRTYTKPARYYCAFGNSAGVACTEAAFVALKPYLRSFKGSGGDSSGTDGYYRGYAGQDIELKFMSTRPDCECIWEKRGAKIPNKPNAYAWDSVESCNTEQSVKYETNGYTLLVHDLTEEDDGSIFRCKPVYTTESGSANTGYWTVKLGVTTVAEENIIDSAAITGFGELLLGQNAPTTEDLSVVTEVIDGVPVIELLSIQWTSGVEDGVVTSNTPSYTIYLQANKGRCFRYDASGKFHYTLDGVERAADGPANNYTNIIGLSYSYGEAPVIAPPDTIVFEQTEFTVYKGYDNRVQIPVTVTPNELLSGQTRTLQSLTLMMDGPEEYAYAPLPDGLYLAGSTPGLLWGVVHDDVEPGTYFVCVRAVSSHGDEQLAALAIVVEELPENLTPHRHSFSDWQVDANSTASGTSDCTHSRQCATCRLVERHAHVWDNGEVQTPATESTHGVMKYTCTLCGTTREAPYLYEYEPEWTTSASAKLSQDGKTLTCCVVTPKSVNAMAIVAAYDASGRMLECYTENVTPRPNLAAQFSVTFRNAAYRYCVFLVSASTCAPIGKPWEYHAP